MRSSWTVENRKRLQFLCREGYGTNDLSKKLNISKQSLYLELKRGLETEEYEKKRLPKYNPIRSIESLIISAVGEENFKFYIDEKIKGEGDGK